MHGGELKCMRRFELSLELELTLLRCVRQFGATDSDRRIGCQVGGLLGCPTLVSQERELWGHQGKYCARADRRHRRPARRGERVGRHCPISTRRHASCCGKHCLCKNLSRHAQSEEKNY